IVQTEASKQKDGIYTAKLVREVRLDEPAWFAARIDSTTKNELDAVLYAHTSPVYVDFDGKRVFDVEVARLLLQRLEQAEEEIRQKEKFTKNTPREKMLANNTDEKKKLKKRISEGGK